MSSNVFKDIRKEKYFLFFIFLFSFLIRALFFIVFLGKNNNYFLSDSFVYNHIGIQIVNGNGILLENGAFNFLRMPGYSAFLAFIYKFAGINPEVAMWVQIILASLLPILIFWLSCVLFPKNILLAKISSFVCAIHLGFVFLSGVLMTETLFNLFFIIFLILFLSSFSFWFEKKELSFSLSKLILIGFCLGLVSLIRPVGQYILFLIILMIFLSAYKFDQKLKKSFILFMSWFLVVLGWLIRNYLLTGFVFFTCQPGRHFLHYTATPVHMKINKSDFGPSCQFIFEKELPALVAKEEAIKGRKLNRVEECFIAEKLTKEYWARDPFLVLRNAFINILKTGVSLYSSDILIIVSGFPDCCYDSKRSSWNLFARYLFPPVENIWIKILIWFEIFLASIILFGFLTELFRSLFNLGLFSIVLKILPIMFLMVALTFASGVARLRFPIEPFMIILAFDFWINFLIPKFKK